MMPRVKTKQAVVLVLMTFLWLAVNYHKGEETDKLIILRNRASYVKSMSRLYRDKTRVEWESLYESYETVNRCTNINFEVNQREFAICNVLKGGSLSWKQFFLYYNIPHTFLDDCQKTQTCPENLHRKIVQVRHPFERLLSTWRHIFKGGGWKLLEKRFVANPELANVLESEYQKITWKVFINNLLLNGTVEVPDITDYNAPWVWIR